MPAEPTVRCYDCGARIPERRAIRRNGQDHCPACDAVALDARRKRRQVVWVVAGGALGAVLLVVLAALCAGSYLLFLGD